MAGIIKNSVPSINIRFDNRRLLKKTNNYPTKLEIYFQGKLKRYDTNINLSETEWKKLSESHLRDEKLKTAQKNLDCIKHRASEIMKILGNEFSFDAFDILYLGVEAKPIKNRQHVYNLYSERIKTLRENKEFSTAVISECACRSLVEFSADLSFKDITVDFLKRYESYMLNNKGNSTTTLGIYLRTLRTIMLTAINSGIIPQKLYPFGLEKNGLYSIPKGKKTERALIESDIQKIIDYVPTFESEARARDMWLFTFFCNGMNMVDILNLKFTDIAGGYIVFYRQKTKRTTTEQQPISIFITERIKTILDKWGNPNRNSANYVFDIYKLGNTLEANDRIRKNFLRVVNGRVKAIAKKIGVNENITTYWARHSWGTTLIKKGVPLTYISKGYGHTSLTTTEYYLGSCSAEEKKEAAQKLDQLFNVL